MYNVKIPPFSSGLFQRCRPRACKTALGPRATLCGPRAVLEALGLHLFQGPSEKGGILSHGAFCVSENICSLSLSLIQGPPLSPLIFALQTYQAFELPVQLAVVGGVDGQVEVVVPGQDVANPPAITRIRS